MKLLAPSSTFLKNILYMQLYLLIAILLFLNIPKNAFYYSNIQTFFFSLGFLSIWRYGWMFVHVIRALIFHHFVFPKQRTNATKLWDTGWRPKRLFILMTTYNEVVTTTQKVLDSIYQQQQELQIPFYLFVGTALQKDEAIIREFLDNKNQRDIVLFFVRQSATGKRNAIAETLTEIIKHGLEEDDPVIFMDGDTYFEKHCLAKCLPFFELNPKLQALTTNEEAHLMNGPEWMKNWLMMRFAQRHFTMQSYSLSKKVLTLTGRMSIFRGKYLLEPGFSEIIANDYLQHWLWGEFRFLSGDDKSTWYYLLKNKADMFYIPDATTITIEYIHGSALTRMIDNLRRWSGNTLRNGARALALGPKRIGFFIWWCLLDQRLSIWTLLSGHAIIVILSITENFAYLWLSLLWIGISRILISFLLFYFSRSINMSFPLLLYCNQLMTSCIKLYTLFHLPQQRWANRGNQNTGYEENKLLRKRHLIANYITIFYISFVMLLILLYLRKIKLPTFSDIITFWW